MDNVNENINAPQTTNDPKPYDLQARAMWWYSEGPSYPKREWYYLAMAEAFEAGAASVGSGTKADGA